MKASKLELSSDKFEELLVNNKAAWVLRSKLVLRELYFLWRIRFVVWGTAVIGVSSLLHGFSWHGNCGHSSKTVIWSLLSMVQSTLAVITIMCFMSLFCLKSVWNHCLVQSMAARLLSGVILPCIERTVLLACLFLNTIQSASSKGSKYFGTGVLEASTCIVQLSS